MNFICNSSKGAIQFITSLQLNSAIDTNFKQFTITKIDMSNLTIYKKDVCLMSLLLNTFYRFSKIQEVSCFSLLLPRLINHWSGYVVDISWALLYRLLSSLLDY